jgi:hypothetical protein
VAGATTSSVLSTDRPPPVRWMRNPPGVVEPRRHLDPPLGAEHRGPPRQRRQQRAGADTVAAVVRTPQQRRLRVHPVLPEHPRHLERAGGAAEDHLQPRRRVDAEVQQGAAALGRVPQPVARVEGDPEAEVGRDRPDLADGAARQGLAQADDRGLEARPHRLHDEDPACACGVDHLLGTGERDREGLLHQQVLARLDGRERDAVVLPVRRGDVHRVDVRVAEQLGVGAVRDAGAVGVREGAAPARPTGRRPRAARRRRSRPGRPRRRRRSARGRRPPSGQDGR